VGGTGVPGLVALVAHGTMSTFESSDLPRVHREIEATARAALG
jgi:hypothetical protein